MEVALNVYSLIQSFLFVVVLLSIRRPENKPVIIYFTYHFFRDLFFMVAQGDFGGRMSENYPVQVAYSFIAYFKYPIVFYFLYSIVQKPLPRPMRLLWALPPIYLVWEYVCMAGFPVLYSSGVYFNWYLDYSIYLKALFVVLLFFQIKNFNAEISNTSSLEKHDRMIWLHWGKYFVFFQLIMSLFLLLYLFFTLANGRLYSVSSSLFTYSARNYNLIYFVITDLFLFVFGYLSIRNPAVFVYRVSGEPPRIEQTIAEIVLPQDEKIFQKKVALTEEQLKRYTDTLKKLVEEDKVFLDAELSLQKLARLSGIPARSLSQFIQASFEKSYKEYISGLRTEHAKNLLTHKNSPRFTMYSIAMESGFNSESSFYRIFKDSTGLTPRQYQEKFLEGKLS